MADSSLSTGRADGVEAPTPGRPETIPPASDQSPDWRVGTRDLVRLQPNRLDLSYGVRAGLFVVLPLFLGLALERPFPGVLATYGALNLFLVQAPRPGRTPLTTLATAAVVNGLAWTAGAYVSTLGAPAEYFLAAAGVSLILAAKRSPRADPVAFIAAVVFVVAIGLPPEPGYELVGGAWFLLGGLWALVAVLLPRFLPWIERPIGTSEPLPVERPRPAAEFLTYAVAVGITVGVGLAIGIGIGLPRDYWVMLTVLVALRPDLGDTLRFSAMRILGTLGGASVAFELSLQISSVWILGTIVVVAVAVALSTRAVNYMLYAFGLTIFLILLLNLAYAHGATLAVDRVLDTAIGGSLALLAGIGLRLWGPVPHRIREIARSGSPFHPM